MMVTIKASGPEIGRQTLCVRIPEDFDRVRGSDDVARDHACRRLFGPGSHWIPVSLGDRMRGNVWKPVSASIGGGVELVAAGIIMKIEEP